jgi:hypothetical protein
LQVEHRDWLQPLAVDEVMAGGAAKNCGKNLLIGARNLAHECIRFCR